MEESASCIRIEGEKRVMETERTRKNHNRSLIRERHYQAAIMTGGGEREQG